MIITPPAIRIYTCCGHHVQHLHIGMLNEPPGPANHDWRTLDYIDSLRGFSTKWVDKMHKPLPADFTAQQVS